MRQDMFIAHLYLLQKDNQILQPLLDGEKDEMIPRDTFLGIYRVRNHGNSHRTRTSSLLSVVLHPGLKLDRTLVCVVSSFVRCSLQQ